MHRHLSEVMEKKNEVTKEILLLNDPAKKDLKGTELIFGKEKKFNNL